MRNKTTPRHPGRASLSPSHTKRGTGRRHLQGKPDPKPDTGTSATPSTTEQ